MPRFSCSTTGPWTRRIATRVAGRAVPRARQLTRWHYQWMVLHEFLPLFIGQSLVDEFWPGDGNATAQAGVYSGRVPGRGVPVRPTLVRPSYRANLAGDDGAPFFGMIFDPTEKAGRPRRPARRRPRPAALRRLANVLRFRTALRTGRECLGRPAQQAD